VADPAHQAFLLLLQNLSGTTFDTTYLRGQVEDQDSSIALYQSEVTNGNYISLVQYARKYLMVLQLHRELADSLLRSIQHP
jgi:predicted outer membrane protein